MPKCPVLPFQRPQKAPLSPPVLSQPWLPSSARASKRSLPLKSSVVMNEATALARCLERYPSPEFEQDVGAELRQLRLSYEEVLERSGFAPLTTQPHFAPAPRRRRHRSATVLQIGLDYFTRQDLAAIGCHTCKSAAIVSAVIRRELRVRDTRDLFEHVSPSAFNLSKLGLEGLAVLDAAFHIRGLGTVEDWARQWGFAPQQRRSGP